MRKRGWRGGFKGVQGALRHPKRERSPRLPTSPAARPTPSNEKGCFEGRKLEPLTPLQPSSQLPCRALLGSPGPGLTSSGRSAAERQSGCAALSCAAPGDQARSRPRAAPGLGAGSVCARPRRARALPCLPACCNHSRETPTQLGRLFHERSREGRHRRLRTLQELSKVLGVRPFRWLSGHLRGQEHSECIEKEKCAVVPATNALTSKSVKWGE